MKKVFLALIAIFAISLSSQASSVTVHFKAGHTMEGELKYRDDTTIVMIPNLYLNKKSLKIVPDDVNEFLISGIGRFYVENGKFVPDADTQAELERIHLQEQKQLELKRFLAADPNAVIGRALKTSGATAIGVGVPSLVVGAILVGIGHATTNGNTAEELASDAKMRGNCSTAGCILLSTGAALTILGIPLYVHGKHIAELKFNYTGNGAGVSVNF